MFLAAVEISKNCRGFPVCIKLALRKTYPPLSPGSAFEWLLCKIVILNATVKDYYWSRSIFSNYRKIWHVLDTSSLVYMYSTVHHVADDSFYQSATRYCSRRGRMTHVRTWLPASTNYFFFLLKAPVDRRRYVPLLLNLTALHQEKLHSLQAQENE